jgi:hypothetical protein
MSPTPSIHGPLIKTPPVTAGCTPRQMSRLLGFRYRQRAIFGRDITGTISEDAGALGLPEARNHVLTRSDLSNNDLAAHITILQHQDGLTQVFAGNKRYLGDTSVPESARLVGYAALVVGLGLDGVPANPALTFDTHTRRTDFDGWKLVAARPFLVICRMPIDRPVSFAGEDYESCRIL